MARSPMKRIRQSPNAYRVLACYQSVGVAMGDRDVAEQLAHSRPLTAVVHMLRELGMLERIGPPSALGHNDPHVLTDRGRSTLVVLRAEDAEKGAP